MGKILYKGSTLFTGETMIQDFGMVVDNGTITDIGNCDLFDPHRYDEVIDFHDRFVMPGLIDCHVHLTLDPENTGYATTSSAEINAVRVILHTAHNAGKLLKSGVTACRELGALNSYNIAIRECIQDNIIPGPDIVAAGEAIAVTAGHGTSIGIECDGPEEIRKAVRMLVKKGADLIKLMVTGGINDPGGEPGPAVMTAEEIRIGVETAHSFGRKVAVHAQGNTGIRQCVLAGVDSIEHGVFLSQDIMELMAARGTYFVPTLSAPHFAAEIGLKEDPGNKDHEKSRQVIERHNAAFLKAFQTGVNIAMGSDSGTPYNLFETSPYEAVLMAKCGLTPREALTAATKNAAMLLGIDKTHGTLEKGKYADFIVLPKNPINDIHHIMLAKDVYKGGKLIR